jgi:hypothetical protein
MAEDGFRALIEQVRSGDERSAAGLVRRYEPMIRCAARIWLTDPRLGRVLDVDRVAREFGLDGSDDG